MRFRFSNKAFVQLDCNERISEYFFNELKANVLSNNTEKFDDVKVLTIRSIDLLTITQSAIYISNQVLFDNDKIIILDKKGNKLDYTNPNEIIVESLFDLDYLYDIFEYTLMNELPRCANSYLLHASSMTYKNKTIVFTGCNNTGKTKVMLEIGKAGGVIHGDDWVVVDKGGNVSTYSRKIRMYQNDAISSPDLIKDKRIYPQFLYNGFKKNNSKVKSLLSIVYGKALHQLKLFPVKIDFSDVSNQPVKFLEKKIDYIFLYSKYSGSEITHEYIEPTIAAKRIYFAIKNEDQKVQDFGLWRKFAFPNLNEFNNSNDECLQQLLDSSFNSTSTIWLKIPFNADFKRVKEYIEDNLL